MTHGRPLRLVAVLTAGLLTLGPVQYGSAAPPPETAPQPLAQQVPEVRYAETVTLVTGHKVTVSRTPDGRQAATVQAPPGADGSVFAHTDGTGDLHVVPRAAMRYLTAGLLDQRLFNVTDLLADGFGDDKRGAIGLIVGYDARTSRTAVTSQAQSLRTAGARSTTAFASADAVAVTVDKGNTAGFWDTLNGTTRTALAGGARKIWLDGKVHANLEQSVPLVGAPQAWAAGYDGTGVKVAVLDSGYDAAHPDLTGKVVDDRSFVPDGTVADSNGHGTHVAATVAGTGAASDGRRKGVAPGADLMVGRVLDKTGTGDESWVLAGMEWAARSGAKVVSMSLGGGASDGNDPMSQAVNSLTAETGALFVIAAGNRGPTQGSVTTPGAATDALTIGNTDKSDRMASSSSRGPRAGDALVKPELTAPGTAIIAARAAGTSIGAPVDQYYTSLSGTSMATPHVAGAAAILAQRHPDWTAGQLKSALVGSTKQVANATVFDAGSGRLDVAAALDVTVSSEQPTLSFGFLTWPNTTADPIQRTVTYRNTGTEPVTLDLATAQTDGAGAGLPDGVAAVDPQQVTVPAGGTASAVLTVVPELVNSGSHVSGLLTATRTDGGGTVRTPWSYGEESERYNLSVDAVARDGSKSTGWAMVWSERMGSFYWGVSLNGAGPVTLRLPKDEYMVLGGSTVENASGVLLEETIAGTPQLQLDSDRTVVLDARQGKPLGFHTPKPSKPQQLQLGWTRWYDSGSDMAGQLLYSGSIPKLAVAPSASVTTGQFEFVAGGRLVAPTATTGRTPYLYDLAIPTAGRLPADPGFTVKDKDLARIDSTFAGVGEAGRTTMERRAGFAALTGMRVNGVSEVHEPGPRVDYVSANGTRWQSSVRLPQAGDENVPNMWDNYATYAPRSSRQTRWWGAPYTTGTDSDFSITDAYRRQNRLSFLYRDYQDGEADHWGDSYGNENEMVSVRSRFYAGDTLLVEQPRGTFSIDNLPPEPATYRMVHTITRRGPIWSSSSYSETDWTFRSEYEGSTEWPPRGVPLLDLNWDVPADVQNRANDLTVFPIGLQARHVRSLTAGTLLPARMWVSYDDGTTWRQVPMVPRGGDRYTGLVAHPHKSYGTGWVSLRGEVRDTAGGIIKQTTIRAYQLK